MVGADSGRVGRGWGSVNGEVEAFDGAGSLRADGAVRGGAGAGGQCEIGYSRGVNGDSIYGRQSGHCRAFVVQEKEPMLDERYAAGELLPAHLFELVGRHVEGSVDVIAHVGHECPSDPVAEMREFRSTDRSMLIQWCEACDWHSVRARGN